MTETSLSGRQAALIRRLSDQVRGGRLDRREFMGLASILGASAATAGGLIGARPARAQGTPVEGGTLRVAMIVRPVEDPRRFDWPEMANVARQFCEPLVRWEPDFTFTGRLLSGWEVSEDAQTYRLSLREGVTWSNGDAFTADHVAYNLARWCDRSVEGNSMATAMQVMIDPDTGKLAEGVVAVEDDLTLTLSLPRPDISLIPAFSDYTALIVHPGFDEGGGVLSDTPIGTGPFELEELEVGVFARVIRREEGWWGGRAPLDAVEFTDYGTDPNATLSALESGEVHVNDETPADLLDQYDSIGLERQEKETAQTICCRMNMNAAPYTDQRVRRAIQMIVDNQVVLNFGLGGRGIPAENHHVGPMHPEYADLGAPEVDVEGGLALLDEAGARGETFDLISIDGDFQRTTMDAVAGQLRQAGLTVERSVIPGATFWNAWTEYPFSATDWGGRPLGVQVLALAYRSGEAWNETGFADPEFDAALDQALGIFDADKRAEVLATCQRLLRESGVIIQPYWRNMYLHHAPELRGYERHQAREMHLEGAWLEE
ncbi:MAG: ABC transporter substrate-binding protein [Pseudomonadota bacterium]